METTIGPRPLSVTTITLRSSLARRPGELGHSFHPQNEMRPPKNLGPKNWRKMFRLINLGLASRIAISDPCPLARAGDCATGQPGEGGRGCWWEQEPPAERFRWQSSQRFYVRYRAYSISDSEAGARSARFGKVSPGSSSLSSGRRPLRASNRVLPSSIMRADYHVPN